MNISGFEFPDDLYYDKNHGWARVDGSIVTQGFTVFAQKLAREILYVEIPRPGRVVEQGKAFMSLESGKWVGRVYALVSGKIVKANTDLDKMPSLVNKSPYDKGWFVQIEASSLKELENLWRANDPAFAELIKGEAAKYKIG